MRKPAFIAFTMLVAALFSCKTASAAKLCEITVAPDFRRVAIKSEGKVGSYSEHKMERPTRLVLDFSDATITKSIPIYGLHKESPLEIRTAKTTKGARVVLDFGSNPLPAYKIRTMDNYVIIFLDDWNLVSRTDLKQPHTKSSLKSSFSVPQRSTSKIQNRSLEPCSGSLDLFIKSADVSNGIIHLTVANKSNPEIVYRIDLGIDFRQMGFNLARIQPYEKERKSMNINSIEKDAVPTQTIKRFGPRKENTSAELNSEKFIEPHKFTKLKVDSEL